jgi:Zn-finger nucleic acid-binding protein
MATTALNCPGCGAPAASDASGCEYCGAALTTVACPACFATMFVGSRYCPRCGAEARREILDEESPSCAACREEMRAVRVGAITFRECEGCGAVWMDGETFERMCGDRAQQTDVRSYVSALTRPDRAPERGAVRYRPCPRCARIMNRVNFARRSGVILDVCKAHGVWLDRDELGRLVSFIDAGGLSAARERDREQERLDAEVRRARELDAALSKEAAAGRARAVAEARLYPSLGATRVDRRAEGLNETVVEVGLGIIRVLFWFLRLIARW